MGLPSRSFLSRNAFLLSFASLGSATLIILQKTTRRRKQNWTFINGFKLCTWLKQLVTIVCSIVIPEIWLVRLSVTIYIYIQTDGVPLPKFSITVTVVLRNCMLLFVVTWTKETIVPSLHVSHSPPLINSVSQPIPEFLMVLPTSQPEY